MLRTYWSITIIFPIFSHSNDKLRIFKVFLRDSDEFYFLPSEYRYLYSDYSVCVDYLRNFDLTLDHDCLLVHCIYCKLYPLPCAAEKRCVRFDVAEPHWGDNHTSQPVLLQAHSRYIDSEMRDEEDVRAVQNGYQKKGSRLEVPFACHSFFWRILFLASSISLPIWETLSLSPSFKSIINTSSPPLMFMRQHIANRIGKKFLKNELLILLENWAAHFGQRVDTGQPNFFGDV